MKLESKYDLGDKVFWIQKRQTTVHYTCKFCEGEKKVTGANNQKRNCPDCYGYGQKTKPGPIKWQVHEQELTIGQVRIKVVANYILHYEDETDYMCLETGVGSGSIYREEDLFPTKEEAEAECKKREIVKEE